MPVPSIDAGSTIPSQRPVQGIITSDECTVVALPRIQDARISQAITRGFGTGTFSPIPGHISPERVIELMYARASRLPVYLNVMDRNPQLGNYFKDLVAANLQVIELDHDFPDIQIMFGKNGGLYFIGKNASPTSQQIQQITTKLQAKTNLSPQIQQAIQSNAVVVITQDDINLLLQVIADLSEALANEVESEFKALESHATSGKARTAPMPLSTLYIAIAVNSLALDFMSECMSSAERREKRITQKAIEQERAEKAEQRKLDAKLDVENKEKNFHLLLAETLKNQNNLFRLLQGVVQERHTNEDLGKK